MDSWLKYKWLRSNDGVVPSFPLGAQDRLIDWTKVSPFQASSYNKVYLPGAFSVFFSIIIRSTALSISSAAAVSLSATSVLKTRILVMTDRWTLHLICEHFKDQELSQSLQRLEK